MGHFLARFLQDRENKAVSCELRGTGLLVLWKVRTNKSVM